MSQALGKRPATLAATQPAAKQPRGGGCRGRGGGGRGAGRKPATRGLGFGLQQAQTSITELIGARRSEQGARSARPREFLRYPRPENFRDTPLSVPDLPAGAASLSAQQLQPYVRRELSLLR